MFNLFKRSRNTNSVVATQQEPAQVSPAFGLGTGGASRELSRLVETAFMRGEHNIFVRAAARQQIEKLSSAVTNDKAELNWGRVRDRTLNVEFDPSLNLVDISFSKMGAFILDLNRSLRGRLTVRREFENNSGVCSATLNVVDITSYLFEVSLTGYDYEADPIEVKQGSFVSMWPTFTHATTFSL